MEKIAAIASRLIKFVLIVGVYLQALLLFQIHSSFFQIPLIGVCISLVVFIPQLAFHTEINKTLENRPMDSLFFLNTTLFFIMWNSLGTIYYTTQNSILEIREYIKSRL